MKKILVTCPPMIGMIYEFIPLAAEKGLELVPAKMVQVLSETELTEQLPAYDGWIIGDDMATRQVFEAGKKGKLRAAVKWGIGVDNVDFAACKDLSIPIINTPGMFGAEVADIALSYVIGLARSVFFIDREMHLHNSWPKPAGISLAGKNIAVIGLGDIGKQLVKRLLACEMLVTAYDPCVPADAIQNIERSTWPDGVNKMDFLIFTCSLNDKNRHMLNSEVLHTCKHGVYVINVARGPLIDESALITALQSGRVTAAALDVFEEEPLDKNSPLRAMPLNILGTHNGSNSKDAVRKASYMAIDKMQEFLQSQS
jgi:D-3-phosphoglycerate dehydrogenase